MTDHTIRPTTDEPELPFGPAAPGITDGAGSTSAGQGRDAEVLPAANGGSSLSPGEGPSQTVPPEPAPETASHDLEDLIWLEDTWTSLCEQQPAIAVRDAEQLYMWATDRFGTVASNTHEGSGTDSGPKNRSLPDSGKGRSGKQPSSVHLYSRAPVPTILLQDPTASCWLKSTWRSLYDRKPTDALRNARLLYRRAVDRLESVAQDAGGSRAGRVAPVSQGSHSDRSTAEGVGKQPPAR